MAMNFTVPPLRRWREWFITDGYIWEWIAAGIVILLNYVIPITAIKPINRYYLPTDPSIAYLLHDNTISSSVLGWLSFGLPILAFSVHQFFRPSFPAWHHSILSLIEGFALASTKRWINLAGRLRPDFLAILANGNEAKITDGRQSFPSGHATYMFQAMTLMTLYMIGVLQLFSSYKVLGLINKENA